MSTIVGFAASADNGGAELHWVHVHLALISTGSAATFSFFAGKLPRLGVLETWVSVLRHLQMSSLVLILVLLLDL